MDESFKKEKRDIKKVGLKVTLPRIKVLELFEKTEKKHLSADEVYRTLSDSGEDVGIATVYRVLMQFAEAGILSKHNFVGEHSVFELDSGEHHDHLLCLKCGKVKEFIEQRIEDLQQEIAEKKGFVITDHRLVIYGVCSKCKIK